MRIIANTLFAGEKEHRLIEYRLRVQTRIRNRRIKIKQKEIDQLFEHIYKLINNPKQLYLSITIWNNYRIEISGRWVILSLVKNKNKYIRSWTKRIMYDDFFKPGRIKTKWITESIVDENTP